MLIKDVSLTKWGNSQGLRIGNDILNELNIEDDEVKFRLEVKDGKIILIPKKEYPQTLNELFADYDGGPLGEDDRYDWGKSVGREVL